jgi:hypothetical protein
MWNIDPIQIQAILFKNTGHAKRRSHTKEGR